MTRITTKTVAIIGAGPAGMAAALQLHRFGIKPLLFSSPTHNSLLNNAWQVENYLGDYTPVTGAKLFEKFQTHLAKQRIQAIQAEVISLDYDFKRQLFKIETANQTYFISYVIVASGTKPKRLLKNPSAEIRARLFYEAFPLLKKRNKTILIIGAGDAAFDNALHLARHNKIIICNRTKSVGALPLLVKLAQHHRNISYLDSHRLRRAICEDKKLQLLFTNQRKHVYIEGDCLVGAIGRLPQKDFYTPKLKVNEKKLLKTGKLFLVGDVKNKKLRQIAIATGDGIKTAMQIAHKL